MDPFLYQYGIGGFIFVVGLSFAWRQGYLGLTGGGLRNLVMLLGGLVLFMGIQGYLQYAPMAEADPIPYTGEPLEKGMIGKPIDYAIMVAYFLAILLIGTFFGRNQKDTKDFFFGGQRFSWWLIAFSLVATTIGSYSFVKYSRIAYNYGLASSQTYLNDWLWVPLLLFGWLPILYFSRLTSIPEYFEHRFGRASRNIVTVLLLTYLVGYVGVNLFTMGKALHILLGWDVFYAAVLVATISAIYVTFGGQTSVIMTDLFQGVMLLATGLVLLFLGAHYLGGMDVLWSHLPRGHRTAFTNFNTDPSYNSVGVYWQDGVANTAMFYFLNQGILMRFMAARSVRDGRLAAIAVLAVLMPIAAVVVASGGWVGKSLVHAGALPPDVDGGEVFFIAAEFLARPGVFGLIMASLTAALMSTVDSLITAISAIVVNDIYNPIRPKASQKELLRVARYAAVLVAVLGVALVPVFNMFDSIYAAHGAFTAAVTPPMVVALLFGVFWRRYTPKAALATLVGGATAMVASIAFPELVAPFAHGVPAAEIGDGWLEGARQGYVWGTISDAIHRYKGVPGTETQSAFVRAAVTSSSEETLQGDARLPTVRISRALADAVEAGPDDLLYVSDGRAWLGGLLSCHVVVAGVDEGDAPSVSLGPLAWERVVAASRKDLPVRVRRLY
ncbi:MAG: sodium:solute symporter family protein [Deltaproteobacteria bacterium]|nr:sodium:solute symporter family protein [Deltaproteobacteria bacterium]